MTRRWPGVVAALLFAAALAGWGLIGRRQRAVVAWIEEGEAALGSHSLLEAEEAFISALELEPRSVRAIFGRGYALLLYGLPTEARAQFEYCVALEPDYAPCHRGLGLVHAEAGDLPGAERALRRAAELAPDDPRGIAALGNYYLQAGRDEEAESLIRLSIELAPEAPVYRLNLVELALTRRAFAEARRELQQVDTERLDRRARLRHALLGANTSLLEARVLADVLDERALDDEERGRAVALLEEARLGLATAEGLDLGNPRTTALQAAALELTDRLREAAL